jgi:hypothetical protein
MKAFMSDAASSRQVASILAERNNYTWPLERDAVDEARMLLAEVEPDGLVQCGHGLFGYMEDGTLGGAHRLLAAALASFVDAPDCAVCGAPFDHGCNSGACSLACEMAAE